LSFLLFNFNKEHFYEFLFVLFIHRVTSFLVCLNIKQANVT